MTFAVTPSTITLRRVPLTYAAHSPRLAAPPFLHQPDNKVQCRNPRNDDSSRKEIQRGTNSYRHCCFYDDDKSKTAGMYGTQGLVFLFLTNGLLLPSPRPELASTS
ncbi:uncharacterized protein LOC143184156 [Calliopsis andreniformis]|uniref:uncharacterized protein LOC143184156 n=1 Tax=Calliopsis andreniformis TaxID=337506 RepID=UPI003FCEC508